MTARRCLTCHTAGIGDPASCDHGASQVLGQLARYPEGQAVAASDLARLSGVPLSVLSQVLLGDSVRGTTGRLLDDGLVERRQTALTTRYALTAEGRALLEQAST